MSRPRDFQRSKLYRAEKVLNKFVGDEIITTEDCVNFINENLLDVLKHYGIKKVVVKDGRGRRSGCAYFDKKTIALPKFARNEWYIIHEVAHLPFERSHVAHGEEFCALYLKLVKHAMGLEAFYALEESFINNGVRW